MVMKSNLIDYIARMDKLEVRPVDSSVYAKTRYSVGKDASVALTKQQYNIVMNMHLHPAMTMDEVYVASGYKWKENISRNFIDSKSAKRKMTEYGNSKVTPAMSQLLVYLKKGISEEIKLDAQWILHESVSLLEAAKRAKNFSVAARILDNLASHREIDSNISNKIIVENAVDYASMLEDASRRVTLEEIVEDAELELLKPIEEAQTEESLTTAEAAVVQVGDDKEPAVSDR